MGKNIKDYLHFYLGCECERRGESDTAILTGISYDDTQGIWWCYFSNKESDYSDIEVVFPKLKPLSAMSEDEWTEVEKIVAKKETGEIEIPVAYAEICKFLLSKRFDLFGLIEANLAIDSTK